MAADCDARGKMYDTMPKTRALRMAITVSGTMTIGNLSDKAVAELFTFKHEHQGQFGLIISNIQTPKDGLNDNIVVDWQSIDSFNIVVSLIERLNKITE